MAYEKAATTAELIERHKQIVSLMTLSDLELVEMHAARWLRAHDRNWARQQRAWTVEDVLLKRAETEDEALSYMSEYLGVTHDG